MIRPLGRDHVPEARPVPEYSQVGELVDHDRLERLGRREDQPPREGQRALPRGTPPSGSGIAEGDPRRLDTKGGRVLCHGPINRRGRPFAQPRSKHLAGCAPVARGQDDMDLVPLIRSVARDARAPRPGGCHRDPESMHLAEIAELRAVGHAAAGGYGGASRFQAGEVPPQPRFPFREKLLDPRLGMSPAPPGREWDGHDDAVPGIDRHPERS